MALTELFFLSAYDVYYTQVYKFHIGAIRDTVVSNIEKMRNGEEPDDLLIRDSIQVVVELGSSLEPSKDPKTKKTRGFALYENDIEKHILEATRTYYQSQLDIWLAENPCTEYLKKVEAELHAEQQRCARLFLHPTSSEHIINILRQELLVRALPSLRPKFVQLLHERTVDNIARWHRLYDSVGLHESDTFLEHVKARGQDLINKHAKLDTYE